MYSNYVTKVGATSADILADLVGILTGSISDPSALSASADFTNYSGITWSNGVGSGFAGLTASALVGRNVYTSGANVGKVISNTTDTVTLDTAYTNATAATATISYCAIFADYEAAGWSVWHNISSTVVVLKAPYMTENGTGYKYVKISTSSANTVNFVLYERWYNASGVDALGNTGTASSGLNATPSTSGQSLIGVTFSTAKSYFYIHANQGHMYITQATSYGARFLTAFSAFEYSRSAPWDTIANGYPPLMAGGNFPNTGPTVMRSLNASGVDVYNQNSEIVFGGMLVGGPPFSTTVPNAGKVPQHALLNMSCQIRANGFFPVDISKFSNIFCTTSSLGLCLDELLYTDGATTKRYVLLASETNTTWRIAVLKG